MRVAIAALVSLVLLGCATARPRAFLKDGVTEEQFRLDLMEAESYAMRSGHAGWGFSATSKPNGNFAGIVSRFMERRGYAVKIPPPDGTEAWKVYPNDR